MEKFLLSAVGAVLLLSSLLKWRDRGASLPFLRALGVGSTRLLTTVRTFEAIVGALLIVGVAPVEEASAAVLLGIAFVVVQLRAWQLGITGGCRCFGSHDRAESPGVSLSRALAFAALAATAFVAAAPRVRQVLVVAHPLDGVTGFFAGVAFVLVFALIAEVVTFQRIRIRAVAANRT